VFPQEFTAKKIAPVPRTKILPLPDPPFSSGKKDLDFQLKFRRKMREFSSMGSQGGSGRVNVLLKPAGNFFVIMIVIQKKALRFFSCFWLRSC
jgi:hypothetical protein